MISRTIAFYLTLACTAMATATPDYKVLLQDGKFEVRTLAGRRQQLLDGDWWPRFTRLVNKPVQGTAADAIKHALILLQGRLPKGAVIVATIHDEIVVECQDEVLGLTKTAMLDGMKQLAKDCPVEVEGGVGKTWGVGQVNASA